jgi:hypothetical protein
VVFLRIEKRWSRSAMVIFHGDFFIALRYFNKISIIYILRFSKSFFLYIASVIPPTWFLELENIRLKLSAHEAQRKTSAAPKNSSILTVLANERQSTPVSASFVDNKIRNNSMLSNETISYYDYDIEIPVKIPDLPDELKVNFNRNPIFSSLISI